MDSIRRVRPFELTAERSRLPTEWQKWKRELERYFDASKVTSQWEKRFILSHLAWPDIQEIFDHLPGTNEIPHVVADPPYYDVAIKKLDEHFEPMRRRNYERHLFRQISQKSDERFADFVLRLRIQAKRCEFDRYDVREVEDRIVEQIVESCTSSELRRQVLAREMSLDEIVSLGTTIADVHQQVKELDRQRVDNGTMASINKVSKPAIRQSSFRALDVSFNKRTDKICFAYGRRGHMKADTACRASNAKCTKCGELGHFAVRCFKRKPGEPMFHQPKKIRLVADGEKKESKEENIFYAMGRNTFEFLVSGVKIPMIIDSGADVNILDEVTWEQAKQSGMEVQDFSWESDRSLRA